jgi:hypothetical protein
MAANRIFFHQARGKVSGASKPDRRVKGAAGRLIFGLSSKPVGNKPQNNFHRMSLFGEKIRLPVESRTENKYLRRKLCENIYRD